MKNLEEIERGIIFWPVGNGDSTTVIVNEDVFLQVDICHHEKAENDESAEIPVLDELLKLLPKKDGEPYLAVFALTHPDEDHCKGFEELLKKAQIGEIWFTPRVFDEFKKDLCSDAKAFQEETKRRIKKVIDNKGEVASGDRIRIVGYSEDLKEDYRGFPNIYISVPGKTTSMLNGTDYSSHFKAFFHSPFKDDLDGDRNDTSLAMQITLINGPSKGKIMLLGDLSYPILRKIYDRSDEQDVAWDVFLAPHHCSKSAMYYKDDEVNEDTPRHDILDDIRDSAVATNHYIIASSRPIPARNSEGDNPPHAKAFNRYIENVAPTDFICTMEHPVEAPVPVVFGMTEKGLSYQKQKSDEGPSDDKAEKLSAVVFNSRSDGKAPQSRGGYG